MRRQVDELPANIRALPKDPTDAVSNGQTRHSAGCALRLLA